LKQFVESIGEEKDIPINSELLEQLEIDEEVYKNVGYEIVLQ